MGEYAEAALWAEMNGRDPGDMSPEDWDDFYEDSKPNDAWGLYMDARMFLSDVDENRDEDAPPSRAETLVMMFPALDMDRAEDLVRGLEALVALPEPESED